MVTGKYEYMITFVQDKLQSIHILYCKEPFLEIKASNVSGMGLFASRNFSIGECLGEYPGDVITEDQITGVTREYAFKVGKDSYIDGGTVSNSIYYQQFERLVDIKLGSLLCFTNHGENENIRPGKTRGGFYYTSTFSVVKDIVVGDELLWYYYFD